MYTDRSYIIRRVATAVQSLQDRQQTRLYLSSGTDSNVYYAEVVAIRRALQRANEVQSSTSRVLIFTDSQVVVQAISRLKGKDCQQLLKDIIQLIDNLYSKVAVKIYQIPRYSDIDGNKKVNILAKEATSQRKDRYYTIPPPFLPQEEITIRTLRLAYKRQIQEGIRKSQ